MAHEDAFMIHQDVRYDGMIDDWESSKYQERMSMTVDDDDGVSKAQQAADGTPIEPIEPTTVENVIIPSAVSGPAAAGLAARFIPTVPALVRAQTSKPSKSSQSLPLVETQSHGTSLKAKYVPTRTHLSQHSGQCRFDGEEVATPAGAAICHPKEAYPSALTNSLNRQTSPPEPICRKTVYHFDSTANAGKTPFNFQSPSPANHQQSERNRRITKYDDTPEPVLKRTDFARTAASSSTSSKGVPHNNRSHGRSAKLFYMNDYVMKDAESDFKEIARLSQPASAAAVTALNIYASLKRARKRPRKQTDVDDTSGPVPENVLRGEGVSQSTGRRTVKKPFAPASYIGKPSKSRITSTTEVNTRRTLHCEEVYKWFRSQPPVTKKYTRSEKIAVEYVHNLIKACFTAVHEGGDVKKACQELRDRLHSMQFYDFMCESIIQEARLFDGEYGLNLVLYEEEHVFPFDLQADAMILYNHFYLFGCDPHLLRGIKTTRRTTDKDRKMKNHSLDPSYPLRQPANYYGAGNLVNGQWWPLQICALRDGAHGVIEGGIYGVAKKGAYSIVLGGGGLRGDEGYADVDHGDTMEYCGTSSEKKDPRTGVSVPTDFTMRMLESCDEIHNEIRVLRKASQSSKHGTTYSPSCGLRYDGLYRIVGKELLDAPTSMYRFRLERVGGQDPIRFQLPERRPTEYERRKFHELESF
ncbi:MAG: hypothetical protein L6R40_006566 [Gallowayella cf. fulva]|nr:MAG: hypothetical protein L6R40_006566 [Xanthomendoza cf. fulva]